MRSGHNQSETETGRQRSGSGRGRGGKHRPATLSRRCALWFPPARAFMTSPLLAHALSLYIFCSLTLALYLCGHLFSVDVTSKWILLNCFNFVASTRVVSLQSDVTVRQIACAALDIYINVCVCVCLWACVHLNCFPRLWEYIVFGIPCADIGQIELPVSTATKNTHLLHAQIKFLLLLWMSIKCLLSVQVVINLIWVRGGRIRKNLHMNSHRLLPNRVSLLRADWIEDVYCMCRILLSIIRLHVSFS